MIRRLSLIAVLLTFASLGVMAQSPEEPRSYTQNPAFLTPIHNARFVYVTSYDGSQFSPNLLPSDREAIGKVQDALQKLGRFTVVYRPQLADMIVAVDSSEGEIAVYSPQSWRIGNYLWRATANHDGFSGSNPILINKLKSALKQATENSNG